jgi:NADPH:quinone reductase-like Zn-dependent oxidoreductase
MENAMKAIVQDSYGSPDVLKLQEIDKPVVEDDEVLVRVRAASVHPDVWHVLTGLPYVLRMTGTGLRKPKNPVPGTDVAGIVESVGKDVTRFQPGDEVFGETIRGYQWTNGGAYAEYATAPEDALALKPANVTFEQAAAIPTSALIALPSLRAGGEIQAGQKVLVNGAGGGVGTVAVQLAKAFGADVTGVDCTSKLDLVRSVGADQVIDYTQEDFTRRDERYDLIFDIPGNHSLSACRRALKPTGTYVLIGHDNYGKGMRRWVGLLPRMFKLMAMSLFVSQLPDVGRPMPSKQESMALLKELLESGKLTPHIDRTYPLSEVPEAIRYLQEGHAIGKVIITV